MRYFRFFIFLILLIPSISFAGYTNNNCDDADVSTWCILTTDTTVDGDTFCGGACDSSHEIIIEEGARPNLLLQDFNGSGSYITIHNEDGSSKVEITSVASGAGTCVLSLKNCSYIDLSGNNDSDYTHGIKVNHNDDDTVANTFCIYGEGDHIKASYIEIYHTDEPPTDTARVGFQLGFDNEGSAVIYDTIELHHLWIHDIVRQGVYIGCNVGAAYGNDDPFIKDILFHDNLIEDCGAYGMNMKGDHSTNTLSAIYNNIIRRVGALEAIRNQEPNVENDMGIGVNKSATYSDKIDIYNNWVEAYSVGIRVDTTARNVYNNVIVDAGNAGTTDSEYHDGILIFEANRSGHIYDNLIVQPYGYGIGEISWFYGNIVEMERNLICDAGSGEWETSGDYLVEGSGADANIYHADCASFNFDKWSDDSDYTNDVFGGRNLSPAKGSTGISVSAALSGTLFGSVNTVDVYFEAGDATPDVLVVDGGAAITYNPPGDMAESTTYYWQVIYHHGWGDETGDVYSFTTTEGPPAPPAGLAVGVCHSLGMTGVYDDQGSTVGE